MPSLSICPFDESTKLNQSAVKSRPLSILDDAHGKHQAYATVVTTVPPTPLPLLGSRPIETKSITPLAHTHTHTPAFCRSRIRLRSCSFSHVPALQLPEVSLILNAAQERCSYMEIGRATCLCSYIVGENTKNAKDNTGYIQF